MIRADRSGITIMLAGGALDSRIRDHFMLYVTAYHPAGVVL